MLPTGELASILVDHEHALEMYGRAMKEDVKVRLLR